MCPIHTCIHIERFDVDMCCRAIFRWISIKDLNKIKFDRDVDPDSPLGLLRGIKFGTESYHDLFKRLCRCVLCVCVCVWDCVKGRCVCVRVCA